MISLEEVLSLRSHRDLELTARAHDLAFTRREAKAQGLAELTAALQSGVYSKAFHNLGEREKEALTALLKGGGALPIPLFSYHFGQIRPYRPWRKDFSPRHPIPAKLRQNEPQRTQRTQRYFQEKPKDLPIF